MCLTLTFIVYSYTFLMLQSLSTFMFYANLHFWVHFHFKSSQFTGNCLTSFKCWLMTKKACNHYDISTYFCIFCLLNFFLQRHYIELYFHSMKKLLILCIDNSAVASKGTITELLILRRSHDVSFSGYLVLFSKHSKKGSEFSLQSN